MFYINFQMVLSRINHEKKVKLFIGKWIQDEIKKGNDRNIDLNKFPESSIIYSTWEAYQKHLKDLRKDYKKNPEKFRKSVV